MEFDPLDPGFLADPYPTMRRLRDESPVHYVSHLGIWAVSRHADVDAILRAPATFSSESGLGRGWTLRDDREPAKEMSFQAGIPGVSVLIGADGEPHARLRRILNPWFSRSRLASLRFRLREQVAEVVEDVIARGSEEPVDLVPELAQPIAARTLATAIGLPSAVHGLLADWAIDVCNSWDPTHPHSHADWHRRLARHGWDMLRELQAVVRTASSRGSHGAVGALLSAHRADPSSITEIEVLSNLVLLVLAGVHTTVCGLASTLNVLATRPDYYRLLTKDPTTAAPVVEESLRLESPIQATWRGTHASSQIGDATIPPGARVWLMVGSANRDERRFESPDKFELRRSDPRLTFGVGPHHCIGGILASLEIESTLVALAGRVASIEPAGPVETTTNLIVRGLKSLPVRFSR